jgi:hypothetical protein
LPIDEARPGSRDICDGPKLQRVSVSYDEPLLTLESWFGKERGLPQGGWNRAGFRWSEMAAGHIHLARHQAVKSSFAAHGAYLDVVTPVQRFDQAWVVTCSDPEFSRRAEQLNQPLFQ